MSDVEERMQKQADVLPKELRDGVVALRYELPDEVWKDFTTRLLDAWPDTGELEAWNTVAADSNKELDRYLREVMPGLPEHYGMPVDGVRRVVKYLTRTDWPRILKKLQDEVADKTGGRLVVGMLNGALVVGEREGAPAMRPFSVDEVVFQHKGCVMVSELIAAWDELHKKDTGDVGYCDLEAALSAAGVMVCNDVPQEQPPLTARSPSEAGDRQGS